MDLYVESELCTQTKDKNHMKNYSIYRRNLINF